MAPELLKIPGPERAVCQRDKSTDFGEIRRTLAAADQRGPEAKKILPRLFEIVTSSTPLTMGEADPDQRRRRPFASGELDLIGAESCRIGPIPNRASLEPRPFALHGVP